VSFELIHAWSARGLDGDGPGFVSVVRTAGLPRPIERLAVACSGHRLPEDDRGTIAMRRFERADGVWTILTATRPLASTDPTAPGTTRRISHHLVLDELDLERIDLGETVSSWRPQHEYDGAPEVRDAPPTLPAADERPTTAASNWHRATGDSGWAGEAILRIRELGGEPLVVLLEGTADTATLAADLLRLLPPEERARLTFADRLRRCDEGLRLVLLDERSLALAEKPMPGGVALLDLRRGRTSPTTPEGAESDTARAGGATISITRARREVPLGSIEIEKVQPSGIWTEPIEVRLEPEVSDRGRWMVVLAAAAIVLALALFAFSLAFEDPTGATP
jgi:hypothetical protein